MNSVQKMGTGVPLVSYDRLKMIGFMHYASLKREMAIRFTTGYIQNQKQFPSLKEMGCK